jgi:hypothetical protein
VLWREDVSSFAGEFVRFDAVRVYPKPVDRRIPVVIGGNSDAALARVGATATGGTGSTSRSRTWPGRWRHWSSTLAPTDGHRRGCPVAVAAERREPGPTSGAGPAGVIELIVVASPPADAAAVPDWWPSSPRVGRLRCPSAGLRREVDDR